MLENKNGKRGSSEKKQEYYTTSGKAKNKKNSPLQNRTTRAPVKVFILGRGWGGGRLR
jgi:hypothetical protein